MNVKYYFVLIVLFLSVIISGCSSSKSLSKEEKAAKGVVLHKAIENRDFVIEVDRMLPLNGRSRTLTSSYSVEIKGEEVKSHLPYFGRAYSIPYGGGDGLIFESTITEYRSSFDDKGKAIIEFKARTNDDQFVFRINIFPNGSASIDVTSNNRQSISFQGTASDKQTE